MRADRRHLSSKSLQCIPAADVESGAGSPRPPQTHNKCYITLDINTPGLWLPALVPPREMNHEVLCCDSLFMFMNMQRSNRRMERSSKL
jgi:hypothetical protein